MPPPEAAKHPRPIAVQTPNVAQRVGMGAAFAAIVVGSLALQFWTPSAPSSFDWQGTPRALLADVNGDGVVDIIGRGRRVGQRDTVRLIALDGKTGKLLWKSEPLGSYLDTYQGPLAVAGGLVLFGLPRGEVRAFSLADGRRVWATPVSERVQYFCAGDDGHVLAVGQDDVLRPLSLASGELEEGRKAPPTSQGWRARENPACSPLPSDDASDAFASSQRGVVDENLEKELGVRAGPLVTGRGGRVFGAMRTTGTSVTMLIALDDDGRVRWQTPMASEALLVTGTPRDVVVGEHEACGVYMQGVEAHVACFALADGRRLWSQAMPRTTAGIQHTGTALLVFSMGAVESRDPATGTLGWRYGR